MEVINNIVPKIIDPIANNEIFVIISLVSENNCNVHNVKNNPTTKNAKPGMP